MNAPRVACRIVAVAAVVMNLLSSSSRQSWDTFFRNIQASSPSGEAGKPRPSALLQGRVQSLSPDTTEKVVEDHLAVHTLIRAYQVPEYPADTHIHTQQLLQTQSDVKQIVRWIMSRLKLKCRVPAQNRDAIDLPAVVFSAGRRHQTKATTPTGAKSCLHWRPRIKRNIRFVCRCVTLCKWKD